MNNTFLKYIGIALLTSLLMLNACKKDDNTITNTASTTTNNGSLLLEFDHKVGTAALVFNQTYTLNNAQVSINKMQYYVSNVVLTKSDGSTYTVTKEQSYFFVKHLDGSKGTVTLTNLPIADYTSVSFVLGIDREKSLTLSGTTQSGVLDNASYPGSEMTWNWNSGYIFVKMEGNVATTTTAKAFQRHIGLYGGQSGTDINNIKIIKLDLKNSSNVVTPAKVSTTVTPKIHLFVDVTKMFTDNYYPDQILSIMSGANSKAVADAYVNMFVVDHVHN